MEGKAIPDAVRAVYDAHIARAENGCYTWTGRKLLATKEGAPGRAVIVDGMSYDVYEAIKVGWALCNDTEYPMAYYRMTCGNTWCVNGEHMILHRVGTRGAASKTLEETTHYNERYARIRAILLRNPTTTKEEIAEELKLSRLGGHTRTIMEIVDRVRSDLNLPLRVSKPRK